jgi:hypothetical protein
VSDMSLAPTYTTHCSQHSHSLLHGRRGDERGVGPSAVTNCSALRGDRG